jgi:uridine kinase
LHKHPWSNWVKSPIIVVIAGFGCALNAALAYWLGASFNLIDNDSYYDIVEPNEKTFSAGTNHDEK